MTQLKNGLSIWTEFVKEIKMALKHKNVHLTIMGMQIKTAFSVPHTPVRAAKVRETNASVADGAGKAQPSSTVGAATGAAFMKSVWRSQKANSRSAMWPFITLGIYPED